MTNTNGTVLLHEISSVQWKRERIKVRLTENNENNERDGRNSEQYRVMTKAREAVSTGIGDAK